MMALCGKQSNSNRRLCMAAVAGVATVAASEEGVVGKAGVLDLRRFMCRPRVMACITSGASDSHGLPAHYSKPAVVASCLDRRGPVRLDR